MKNILAALTGKTGLGLLTVLAGGVADALGVEKGDLIAAIGAIQTIIGFGHKAIKAKKGK